MKRSTDLRITLLCILIAIGAGFSSAHAQPSAQQQGNLVYMPLISGGASASPGSPSSSLPPALVGTWFSGQLLPRALYDPTTGQWGSANGLGQMYEFAADGGYTYLAFFRIETPGCSSEVSVYRHGTAHASAAIVTLQPVTVKTRTVIYCGGRQESVTSGPYEAQTIPWEVGYDQFGVKHLTITEDGKPTSYFKDGMAEELAGGWHNGDIASAGFYNPTTRDFAAQPGEGWWISISADGHYRWGEFAHAQDQQGCMLTGWLYMEGTIGVSGSHILFTPTAGVARVENACVPDQPRQEPWVDEAKGFTWLFRERETNPKLVLLPDGRFEENVFLPE